LPSGTVVHVAGELLETVKAVSNHLNISQRLAAILLVTAEAEQSSWPSRTVVEISTYLLYGWQAQMLDFFTEVLAMAIGRDQLVGTVFDPIRDKIAGLLERKVKVGNGEGTFVDLILNQLDDLQSRLDQLVRTQRVVGPEYDLLVFRIESLRASQNRLIRILSVMAFGGVIGRGQVVKLLKWLKKTDKVDGLVMGVFR
jgi:nuclear pore complex protein Nup205